MNDKMRVLKYMFLIAGIFTLSMASAQDSEGELEFELKERIAAKTVQGVKLGTLMCENSEGKLVVCSGNEFEKVLGFATSIPYVTVNKRPAGVNRDEYDAFASMEGGVIKTNDYLCAAEGGKVKRCDRADSPYAKAIDNASINGQKLAVRVLGVRR